MAALRYYLDEHIAGAVTQGLRRRGLDALTLTEAGTGAQATRSTLRSPERRAGPSWHDDDFLRLAAQTMDHAGVVYLPQRRSIGETVRGLTLIADVLGAERMRGHVEFL